MQQQQQLHISAIFWKGVHMAAAYPSPLSRSNAKFEFMPSVSARLAIILAIRSVPDSPVALAFVPAFFHHSRITSHFLNIWVP